MRGPEWFQLQWQGLGQAQQYGITAKELFPVVDSSLGAAVARSDNVAVVATVNS